MKIKYSLKNKYDGHDIYDMVKGDVFLEDHYDDVFVADRFEEKDHGKVLIAKRIGMTDGDGVVTMNEEVSECEFFYVPGFNHYGPSTYLIEEAE